MWEASCDEELSKLSQQLNIPQQCFDMSDEEDYIRRQENCFDISDEDDFTRPVKISSVQTALSCHTCLSDGERRINMLSHGVESLISSPGAFHCHPLLEKIKSRLPEALMTPTERRKK